MTNNSVPWDDIESPKSDYNVRQLENSNFVPMYWGKDIEGNCLFILELEGDHKNQIQKNKINCRGIRVDLRLTGTINKQSLILTLEKHIDRDLFFGLCTTLASSVHQTSDSATAVAVTLQHLHRWKTFLAGTKVSLLSIEKIRGLFAELIFLRTLYQEHLTQDTALNSWYGPDGGHQDFKFGNSAIEIKALSGHERNTVKINSEDQLEVTSENLYLKIYRLSEMPNLPDAKSINQLVQLMVGELTSSVSVELLYTKLAAYGYVEMLEYEKPKLVVTGKNVYSVTGDFPKLVRSEINDGLARVNYEIKLESITDFECDLTEIWGVG